MADTLGRGLVGSLRKRVAHEIKLHRRENRAMRRARYSLLPRAVRGFLAGRPLEWFVGAYIALGLVVVLVGSVFSQYTPWLLSE